MSALIMVPDVEMILIEYLRPILATRPESSARQASLGQGVALPDRTPWMIMIQNNSGPRLDVARQQVTVGFNIWGQGYQPTLNLARLVAALVWASPADLGMIDHASGPTGPYQVPDASGQTRLYFTFTLIIELDET